MIIGPVFAREVAINPRRPRFYIYRALYPTALLVLMFTAWLILTGTQVVSGVGDMARFGYIVFQILAVIQLPLVIFFAAMSSASSIALEKDRRTLVLLLMTRLSNHELVLGKLMASLLNLLVMLAAGLPIFFLVLLFGGVSVAQLMRVFAVTLVTGMAFGSLGSMLAFWREKTFQTLALTALSIVFWLGLCEIVAAEWMTKQLAGVPCETWAAGFSPVRATFVAAQPIINDVDAWGWIGNPVNLFLGVGLSLTFAFNLIAVLFLRVWNPSREVQGARRVPANSRPEGQRAERDFGNVVERAEAARSGHVDSRLPRLSSSHKSRPVWDNPILWRETSTWAYGRKIIFIRVAYIMLFAFVALALHGSISTGLSDISGETDIMPLVAKPLVPFLVVSLVIVNALAVTSITSERDGRSLDLLLVTDLLPSEFIFGKLGGVLWVTKEMVLLPLLLCVWLWGARCLTTEDTVYVLLGLLLMYLFVVTLGIHCGMIYSNTKTAIGVSAGTVFFLCLGVLTCVLMMISFSGSFQVQLAPFLGFILGGGVGLYVSLGARNPSAAIALASIVVPFATFYAVVSFLLRHSGFTFLVTVSAYGFSTAAMLIPALHEFDFAMGRTTAEEE